MPDTSPAPADHVPPDHHIPLVPGSEPVPGYVLVRKLGQGGFGEVWRATAPGGFPVAMKFVTLTEKAAVTELRSLEVLRELRHPNVLPVSGAWQTEWRLTVAMELADGTLLDRLREVQAAGEVGIPGPELLAHLRGAAAGLDYLHARNLQHRDVKPQNLLLVGGAVKLADFGMARALKGVLSVHTSSMTVEYAPPEFFRERVSRHSDQYSLAVAYCELRGGRRPFAGTPEALMLGHVMGEPDLSMLPEAERPIVARALAKEPDDRWASCGEFAEAIGWAMTEPIPVARRSSTTTKRQPLRSPAVTETPPRRRGSAVALFGLAAVVATGVGVAVWPKGDRTATTDRESQPVGSAKADPLPAPETSKPAPASTGKTPLPAAGIDTDIKSKDNPEPPKSPADDDKTYVSRTSGMKFKRIPAGTFLMGSPDSDVDAYNDEKPQHKVTLTKDFYIGVYEVTLGQFRVFIEDTGYKTEAERDNGAYGQGEIENQYVKRKELNWRYAGFKQTDEHPVVNVSCYDAVKFCEWLSRKDECKYRLPTEAEWEYACRGTDIRAVANFKYHFGDDPSTLPHYANFGSQHKGTTPVGLYRANQFGLYDMHGNVWEWCEEGMRSYESDPVDDPVGPAYGFGRVCRGGGWVSSAKNCRSADRYGLVPSTRYYHIGFRLVQELPNK